MKPDTSFDASASEVTAGAPKHDTLDQRSFRWDAKKGYAAQLLAYGDLTDAQIAKQLRINKSTLFYWKKHPEFAERVEQNLEDLKKKIADQSFQSYRAKTDWRDPFIEQLIEVLTNLTPQDFEPIKKNPIATANLLLRLQHSVDATQRRRDRFDEDDDNYPFVDDVSPETAQRIREVMESVREP